MTQKQTDDGLKIVNQFKKLVLERQPLDTEWEQAYQYTYPLKGQGFKNNQNDQSGIQKALSAKNDKAVLFDSTATDAVRLLASSSLSGLTPSYSQWFNLAVPDVEPEQIPHDAKIWLEKAAESLWVKIHSSNYDSQALDYFTNVITSGMAGLYIELDDKNDLHFEEWPLSSMYCQDLLGQSRIDTVYRNIMLTGNEAPMCQDSCRIISSLVLIEGRREMHRCDAIQKSSKRRQYRR